MKATVRKCSCGRVSNPIQLDIVKDAWIKGNETFYEFDCPQCRKTLVVSTINDRRILPVINIKLFLNGMKAVLFGF